MTAELAIHAIHEGEVMLDPMTFKRRIPALLAAGLLAVSGAAAAGCGDDDNVSDQIDQAVDDAQGQADELQNEVDNATQDAQDQLDQAADDAQQQLEDAQNELDDALGNDGG